MSETEEVIQPEEAAAEVKYRATFVRDNFHALRDHTWDKLGRCIIVSEETMFHLEEHAFDNVSTSDGDNLTKDRFEFEVYEGPEPVGYRFPTDDEAAKAAAAAAAIEKSRRNAIAKARVDAEMADFDKSYTPTPRARSRSR